ncbi:hypothetical protein THTE_3027 [Thermogutta terrifontis]|uniref:Uncharacterized protein n=1 Tax=Thermogutta terrifontis TaxID=1331910 RepID=A0A286RI39_9BACT|nr:hypothetical protein THTE_3027 [Thermogutta terrifontis]
MNASPGKFADYPSRNLTASGLVLAKKISVSVQYPAWVLRLK